MKNKSLLKKFFHTTSLEAINLDDINNQLGNLRVLKRTKVINSRQEKEYRKFLENLQDDKIDAMEDQKALVKSKIAKAHHANEQEKKKVMNAMRSIQMDTADTTASVAYKPKNTYLVSFTCKGMYPSGRYTTMTISQTVEAVGVENDNHMIRKAFLLWVQLHYLADSPPDLVWPSIKHKRISENGVTTSLSHVHMGNLLMMYKSFADLPAAFRSGKHMCVVDYLVYESNKAGRKGWFAEKLTKSLGHKPNLDSIVDFAKKEGDVSVYALDMFYKVFRKVVATKSRIALYFMVNNGHCYPILNETQRKQICVSDKLIMNDMRLTYKDFQEENVEDLAVKKEGGKGDYDDDLLEAVKNSDAKHVIITDVNDLTLIAGYLMRETGFNIEKWNFHERYLRGFQHPIKSQIISSGMDYAERKIVCEQEYAKKQLADFKFLNQGWGTIARSIFEEEFGAIPSSSYSPDVKLALANGTVPYRMCNSTNPSKVSSIDITKCYASILEKNKYEFPVHGAFDCAEPVVLTSVESIKPGQYYVAKNFYMGMGHIKESKGWKQYEIVHYAVEQGYLALNDVTHATVARRTLKASTFKVFVAQMFKAYPNDAKKLVNCFVGCLGSLYHRSETAGVTTDEHTMLATMDEYRLKGLEPQMNEVENLFIVRLVQESMKNFGDVPIYRSIINQSRIALDKLTKDVVLPGITQVIGYNTDSIKVRGKFCHECISTDFFPRGSYRIEQLKMLTGYSMEELKEYPEWKFEPLVLTEETDSPVSEKSELRLGVGGCGKSWLLSKNYVPGDVVLCYTNACCEQLKRYGVLAQTFESYVPDFGKGVNAFQDAKRVWLDEYKTLPPSNMDVLLRAKEQYNFQLICLGDWRQTKAPCDDWVEYHRNRRFLMALGGRVVTMSYKEQTGRYDKRLYDKLNTFVMTGKLDLPYGNTILSDYNVCHTNVRRHEINSACLARWVQKNKVVLTEVKGKQDSKDRVMNVAVGLEMMVYYENDLEKKLYKTHRYVICEIKAESVVVANESQRVELLTKDFVALFDYAFS